ncbi:MAG: L-threonylcarbamoyladenylate synthase [Candidatus Babeliales bacterium]
MKKLFYWENKADLPQIVTLLNDGNISICNTDTVLGFLAKVSEDAFRKINNLKGRQEKPYIVLVSSPQEASEWACLEHEKVKKIIARCWPGPVTLILSAKDTLPPYAQSKNKTIALRMPAHEGLLSVIKQTGPLFSTSANKAGEPVPATLQDINPEILESIDFLVTDRKPKEEVLPSTIIDCTNPDDIKIIRAGSFANELTSLLR